MDDGKEDSPQPTHTSAHEAGNRRRLDQALSIIEGQRPDRLRTRRNLLRYGTRTRVPTPRSQMNQQPDSLRQRGLRDLDPTLLDTGHRAGDNLPAQGESSTRREVIHHATAAGAAAVGAGIIDTLLNKLGIFRAIKESPHGNGTLRQLAVSSDSKTNVDAIVKAANQQFPLKQPDPTIDAKIVAAHQKMMSGQSSGQPAGSSEAFVQHQEQNPRITKLPHTGGGTNKS